MQVYGYGYYHSGYEMTPLYSMALPIQRVNIVTAEGETSYGFLFMEAAEKFIEKHANNADIIEMYLIRSKT